MNLSTEWLAIANLPANEIIHTPVRLNSVCTVLCSILGNIPVGSQLDAAIGDLNRADIAGADSAKLDVTDGNGDSSKVDEGKKRFIGSAIGLAVLLLSGVILHFLNPLGFVTP